MTMSVSDGGPGRLAGDRDQCLSLRRRRLRLLRRAGARLSSCLRILARSEDGMRDHWLISSAVR